MVKIIVDSTCDLPDEILEKHNIEVLPLTVCLGNKEYQDKKTINVDEVYDIMREGIVPRTAQPNPATILNVFEQLCQKGQDFIYIAFSSALSGTCQTAQVIAAELKKRYPNISMAVIDSKSGSTATGLIVLQMVKLIEKGYGFNELLNYCRFLVNHIEHIFSIADLSWLVKGGRLSKTKGVVGNIMNIWPILSVKNGTMEVMEKVRGRKKALNRIVDIIEIRINNFFAQPIGISHADDLQTAEELMDLINTRFGKQNFIVNKIGSVLGSHLGIGGVGVFFFNSPLPDSVENSN